MVLFHSNIIFTHIVYHTDWIYYWYSIYTVSFNWEFNTTIYWLFTFNTIFSNHFLINTVQWLQKLMQTTCANIVTINKEVILWKQYDYILTTDGEKESSAKIKQMSFADGALVCVSIFIAFSVVCVFISFPFFFGFFFVFYSHAWPVTYINVF